MTKLKIGINGFGRIGRIFTRIALEKGNIEIVAINDLTDTETLAQLFKYDSVHGRFAGTVTAHNGELVINDKSIRVTAEPNPENINWADVDMVLEASGRFRKREEAEKHLKAGAKKVLLSAPPKSPDIEQFVLGVNQNKITGKETILSNASCTTNSVAHIVKHIDNRWGIENGFLTTVHAFTSDQRLHDAPHKDLRRARAATNSIIPTSTGAAKAIVKLFPHLDGHFVGNAARVPVIDGSYTDLTLMLKESASVDDINGYIHQLCQNELKGLVEYNVDPIVSVDIIGNPHSGIFDSTLTSSFGKLVKVVSWYDNEYGYSSRLVDLAGYFHKHFM